MEGKEGERLFLCRISLSYPTKNPASVIQVFLQASGAGTDCRHDYPGDSHLQAELEMRARASIMNFLCSHRQELSLISFSGSNTPLSYTGRWPGWNREDLGHGVEEQLQALDTKRGELKQRNTDWQAHQRFQLAQDLDRERKGSLFLQPTLSPQLGGEKGWRWMHLQGWSPHPTA